MEITPLLQRAIGEGVAHPDNRPFLLPAQTPGSAAGVLLVHGFGATPHELYELGETCARAGLTALGVRLPGHGTTPADLAGRRWQEWLEAVEEGWALLARETPRVYGVGISTGALLLLLAARQRPAAGLVLLSPFLRLSHPWAWAARWLAPFHPYQPRELPVAKRPYYYAEHPLSGVAELRRLVGEVRRGLPQQVAPTLILAGSGDQTVRPEGAAELFRRLESARKEFHLFGDEAGHVLTAVDNPRRTETLALTRAFLCSLEGRAGRSDAGKAA